MSFDLSVVNGDLAIKNGDLATVTGQDKLVQDIEKICLTTVGCNIFQPWYGSYVSKTLIGQCLDAGITETVAKTQLQNSLENLKKLQQFQLNSGLQEVVPAEHIAAIQQVNIQRDSKDPRIFRVVIKVLNRMFRSTVANFTA